MKYKIYSHEGDDGGGYVVELDATLMQTSHQQLAILACGWCGRCGCGGVHFN